MFRQSKVVSLYRKFLPGKVTQTEMKLRQVTPFGEFGVSICHCHITSFEYDCYTSWISNFFED